MDTTFAKRVGSFAVTTLVLGGCATTGARIVTPLDGSALANCNQAFVVEFHPNFLPGSFRATVDGADWTPRFTASPGGTSSATATAAYGGIIEHRLEIDSDVRPSTNGYEPAAQNSSVKFLPPQIRFFPNGFTIAQNGSASANVCLQPPPAGPLAVVLTPEGGSPVLLNGNTAGVPITLTFPVVTTAQSCVPLTVTAGTVPGSFIIRAASVGCQIGGVSGVVP